MVEGLASFIFAQKLKFLKDRVIRWKKEEFGSMKTRKL